MACEEVEHRRKHAAVTGASTQAVRREAGQVKQPPRAPGPEVSRLAL